MFADQALLSELARRLRSEREAARLSISELARRAGLSRRFLTEAEAGRANPSFLNLARLAAALRVPLGRIADLPLGVYRGERVALVGLRGAGKTTVGRRLALALEVPFVELDRRVEELAGMPLAEIFDLRGAETYRRLEAEALEQVLAGGQRQVIATGGSIVTAGATFDRLREACRTVWLAASPETHLARVTAQGDTRPMEGRPRVLEELREILEGRAELYAACEVRVDTDEGDVEAVTAAVLAAIAPAGSSARGPEASAR